MSNEPVNYKFFFDLRRDIDALQAQVRELRAFVDHLDGQCQLYARDNTGHIQYIYNAIRVLHDQVSPIEEWFFPAVSDARDQLARIIEDQRRDKPEERPPT